MTASTLDHPLPEARRAGGRRGRRRILLAGVAALLVICLILVGLAWRASNVDMNFAPAHYSWSLSSYPALERVSTPLTVHSSTGVTLVGRFFRGSNGATVVMSHGYGGDQDEMLPAANMLHAEGFNVVTYNERGRDGSGGTGTWGALETQDLRSVLDTVVRHRYVNPAKIGLFGFSIGADVSILEAARDARVKAVVADGSWPSLKGYMKPRLSDVLLHPTSMYSPLALKLLELRTGANLDAVQPGAVIARISPRPILLIQGLADTDVTPNMGIATFHDAKAPRRLWLVKGAGHEDTVRPGGAATSPRVGAFFTRALSPSRG